MEIIYSLIDFFELYPDVYTFSDFIVWFSRLSLAVVVVSVCIKALFKTTWKVERMMR